MTWQKVLLYVLGGVALIVLGWLLHSAFTPKPSTQVEERIVRDTIKTERTITVYKQTKPTIIRDTTTREIELVDTTAGIKDDVEYKVQYSYKSKEGLWDIQLKPLINTITEYVTRDSIQTVVDTRYIQAPFFLNPYFYVSIGAAIIAILAIIF